MATNQKMIVAEALPQSGERAAQAEAAANALVSGGYVRIGIDHFALPGDSLAVAAASGRLRRNFQGYTSDPAQTLIGLGATSIGRTPEGYVQNISETGAWSRAVAAARLPVARGHKMRGEDLLRAHVIERIMCDGAIDLAAAGRAFGYDGDWWAGEDDALAELADDGLLVRSKGQVTLNPGSPHFARILASVFDTYLSSNAARHSVAV
jgi:oxygen-independent coproporphyrinogen-3 oxidase